MRNKIFEKIPVTIPNRSGFDLSHENCGTGKVGLLIPVMTREMEGHDSLSVNIGQQIQFPPFATDFYGRIKVYFEAFFVPYRIISGSYKHMYRRLTADMQSQSGTSPSEARLGINPYFEGLLVYGKDQLSNWDIDHTADPSVNTTGRGSLLDYLGVKTGEIVTVTGTARPLRLNNFHRLSAYHRIFEEYYRDARIQTRCFDEYISGSLSPAQMLRTVPYRGTPANNGNKYWLTDAPLADGTYMTGFHARPYAKDYFTTATPDPQFGNEMSVQSDANGNISISQIRAANALQQFMEIYNKAGNHYDDLAFALTGIRPSDAAVDIPIYLGRKVYDVYNKSVFVSTIDPTTGNVYFPNAKGNPFASVGTKYANGQSLGSGHLCDFTATEGGIFMVLMSVAPDAIYSSGCVRQWDYNTIFDLPKPQLAGIGDQPIYKGELTNNTHEVTGGESYFTPFNHDDVFGYTQRFAEAKFMLDEVHGELREYGNLEAFALKRHFDSALNVNLGTAFLRVSTSALDEVSAFIDSSQSGSSPTLSIPFYWFDLFFEVKLVSNLPAYSVPTLENMKGHSEMIDNGGRRL